ncbi:MAG: CHAT domain-containing protein, partial [Candidatus Aminicenantaceae bacterium]
GGQILWEAYFEIANSYKEQKDYQKSLKNYKNSISVIEDIRSKIKLEELKASYLGANKRIEAYHNLIDLLVKLHQANPEKAYDVEAFNYLERAKARAFLDSLEVSEVNVSQGVNSELLNQERELIKELSNLYVKLLAQELSQEQKDNLNEELKSHEHRLESLRREIRTTSPVYAGLKYPQIISLEEAQEELIDNETGFFEYLIGKDCSYAFVVTKKTIKIFKLPSAREIRRKVSDYIKAITDRDNRDFKLGYELFSTLVLPGLNKKIKKIIFAPDDILHFLPYETLISKRSENEWLIKNYRIAYAPSISSLSEIIQHKKLREQRPQKDIVAFGDPFFGVHETVQNGGDLFQDYYSSNAFNFFRLKYSGDEIDRIASLFSKTKIYAAKRKKATEERLRELILDDYKILHFATHCLIDDKKPARSSIVLSLGNNDTEDGFLQMREIFNLKLNADLVTLSACQTGLGQFIRGEGIEGLNRAFFYAGTTSVLMSLWAVNDQATSHLMQRFYTRLRSSESIISALQKAKLELISSDTLSHPYYWAGFVVTGKTDEVIFPSNKNKWVLLIALFFTASGIIVLIRLKNKN